MIMPNIGAFIAWGLLTALFIPTGWWPNEYLGKLVDPMLKYLLPILIGYTAGKNIAGDRGGVTGAIATMGVVIGSSIPMFIGAMMMGPLGGWCIKKFDEKIEGKVKDGFEMLINNFSIGIIGMLLAIFGYMFVGDIVIWLTKTLSKLTVVLIDHHLLPLVALVVEPAKVMFLNNAIRNMIRENKIHQIDNVISMSMSEGMISMNNSLLALLRAGRIDKETCITNSPDPEQMRMRLV